MLDILVSAVSNYPLPSNKVTPIVKILCLLLEKHHNQK